MGQMTQLTVSYSEEQSLINQVKVQSHQAQLSKRYRMWQISIYNPHSIGSGFDLAIYIYSTTKTEDTQALRRHRAKPTKIKAKSSRMGVKTCFWMKVQNTATSNASQQMKQTSRGCCELPNYIHLYSALQVEVLPASATATAGESAISTAGLQCKPPCHNGRIHFKSTSILYQQLLAIRFTRLNHPSSGYLEKRAHKAADAPSLHFCHRVGYNKH